MITDGLSLTREAFYGEYYNLITNCSNIATSLLNIATSCVFTKDVAMLSRDVAMLVLTLLDVKSLSRLKIKVDCYLPINISYCCKISAHLVWFGVVW